MKPAVPRSHSLNSTFGEKKEDQYGIGFASDSDEEAEGCMSMPNLGGNRSASALSTPRIGSSVAGSAGVGMSVAEGHGWGNGKGGTRGFGGGDFNLFFIWVNPMDPCADRATEWPLPDKYRTHVQRWEERYQVTARVYGGQQCLEMVQRVNSDVDADCSGLLDVYLDLAAKGIWIKMVDIARVAIIYLEGGMYLDTDMDLGPRTFSEEELLDSETCYLVHDADGALQNHFFRAPKRHGFIRHVLHVLKVNSLAEPHVVQATGPCALTAALNTLNCSSMNIALPSPPVKICQVGAAADLHQDEGEGVEEDFFSKGQMEGLIGRIRHRLLQGGYTPINCDNMWMDGEREGGSGWQAWHAAGLRWSAWGPSKVFIYPPRAFHVIHWREDRGLALGRSLSQCFAMHNWDTTWAPQELAGRAYMAYLGGYLSTYAYWPSGYRGEVTAPGGGG